LKQLYSTGSAILKFIRFAEAKVEDGTLKKNRLIHPGQRRLRKWIKSLGTEDSTVDSNTPGSLEGGSSTVYLGSGFNKKKDPEHLPAATTWEKIGNGIRTIPHFLGSVESAFGARVACKFKRKGAVAAVC
jgi:capsid portal protein